ncbi:MAG: MFS transporter [Oscillospiraceae bacterium]|nr:MFS transporter [Oscillospiraceae bacterium]
MELQKKLSSGIEKAKLYWHQPPRGRYMTYKEILSYSMGGMGVKFIVFCVQNMIISVSNTLIGNTIGIAPKPLYAIYLLSVLSGFPLTALRARMIDNTRSMKGKYRPYVLIMGIPTAILGTAFIWMPYENMGLLTKCVVVLLFNIGFQFFYNFMNDAFDSLLFLLSPNTIERSDVCSIKSVIENFSPSVASIFLPIVASWITGDTKLYDLRIYRVIYPPMLLVGLLMAVLVHVNTKEKIVQAKTHVVQLRFLDAFRAVARNKYFWILSLAGWLGFLENSFDSILGWLYNYQKVCTPAQYSLITAITGNASFWPNLIAPGFIRKYGKRKILIYTNLMSVVFILMMYPVIAYSRPASMIWLFTLCFFINKLVTALGHLLHPSINADIRDYQQYITGERIDGMFATIGLIGSVITLATNFVLPAIYERAGLNESVAISLGYSGANVYDVLNNSEYFMQIALVLILASALGALLNVIPFFFFDLTETKQRAMVTVLKIRALFEDYGNNALSDEALVEAIDLIEEAKAHVEPEPRKLSKDEIRAAKKSKDKQAAKQARQLYYQYKEENEKIEIAKFIMREINRFDTVEGMAEIAGARQLVDAGIGSLADAQLITLRQAKALPKQSEQEKESRKAALMRARNIALARKTIKNYYEDGLVEFDMGVFDKLFAAEDKTEIALKSTLDALLQAKNKKNRQAKKQLREEITVLRQQKTEIKHEIKKAMKQNSIYNRAAKPYLDAKKLLIQQENYRRYEDIAARYAESKERAEKAHAEKQAQIQQERKDKELEAERLKAEKEQKKRSRK